MNRDSDILIRDYDDPNAEPIRCTLGEFLDDNADFAGPDEDGEWEREIVTDIAREGYHLVGGGAAPAYRIEAA